MIVKLVGVDVEITSPVTLNEWARFVRETGYFPHEDPRGYLEALFRVNVSPETLKEAYMAHSLLGEYPVTCISYADALAYCKFVKGELPTEDQMEKALEQGYPYGLWLWCQGPWQATPETMQFPEFASVKGCGCTTDGRYPFKPLPTARMALRISTRRPEIGFCVVHKTLDVVSTWSRETEEGLFD